MSDPNVLLVVLDSVRARNVGLYGYHRRTTPFLSDYGTDSTVYAQARAPGIHSVASHASLWTGAHVEQHQVKRHEDELVEGSSVWESLSGDGYRTGIFTTNPVVAHSSNLAEAFDDEFTGDNLDTTSKPFPDAHSPADVVKHEGVVGNLRRCAGDDQPVRSFLNSVHHFYIKKRGAVQESLSTADLIEEFLAWETEREGPWAACLNLMDAHFPYEPSPENDRWGGDALRQLHASFEKPPANEFVSGRPWWQLEAFEHLYDGTILELDGHLRRLLGELETRGVHGETLVVVTSDHGEGFGELSRLTGRTRLVDHSWGIHEALTHVPLVVSYPGQEGGSVVDEPVSLAAFPDAVSAVRDGETGGEPFVADGPVVSSTDRLLEQDDGIFDGSEESRTDYYGPWMAVYERTPDGVLKYARRGEAAITLRVPDAGQSCLLDRADDGRVDRVFADLEPMDLKKEGSRDLSEDIEEQLTELGYLR